MFLHDTLMDITEPMGVSGREKPIRDCLRTFKPESMEETVDAVGNLMWTPSSGTVKFVLTAHMDEIGIMVSGHTDDGKLEIVTVGGFDPRSLVNQVVLLEHGGCRGIIGLPAPHIAKDKDKVIPIDELRVDAGYETKEEAEESAPIGTVMVVEGPTFKLNDDVFVSRNTDNRSGCAILIMLAKTVAQYRDDVAIVFTVREEIGLMGAKGLQESFLPDAEFINIDVTTAGEIGKGCVVSLKDGGYMANIDMVDKFKAIGAAKFEVGKGGTSDHAALQYFRKACGVSLPSAHIHSHVSKVSLSDMLDAFKLIKKYIESE